MTLFRWRRPIAPDVVIGSPTDSMACLLAILPLDSDPLTVRSSFESRLVPQLARTHRPGAERRHAIGARGGARRSRRAKLCGRRRGQRGDGDGRGEGLRGVCSARHPLRAEPRLGSRGAGPAARYGAESSARCGAPPRSARARRPARAVTPRPFARVLRAAARRCAARKQVGAERRSRRRPAVDGAWAHRRGECRLIASCLPSN